MIHLKNLADRAAGEARWHRHFLKRCVLVSEMSKDPSTRVGSVIVDSDHAQRSDGFNGFPRGVADTVARLNDRDMKLRMIVHAERNALLNAARIGVSVKGCTLYIAATSQFGDLWGGCPCSHCTIEIIQAGIARIVTYPMKYAPDRWRDDMLFARELVREAGLEYMEVEP